MSKQIDEHVLQLYDPKKLMGSGAYGHVWKATDRRTRTPVALKKIFDAFQNSTDAQRTYREVTLLSQLQHPNIVKLLKAIRAKNNKDLYLVFEVVQADLHSLVGQQVLQPTHVRFICSQLLRALSYLHSAQLIHRDLKPSNVLINSDCRIKICDFGLARSLVREEEALLVLTEEVATRWYRSPQMLLGSRDYGKPTDVWSVGCILAELMIGHPLFQGSSTLDQLQQIIAFTGAPSQQSIDSLHSDCAETLLNQLSVRKRSLKEYFQGCDPEMLDLVTRMLEFSPNRRITVDEALKFPCLKEFHEQIETCQKFIVPPVDDNLKLSVGQYRKLIYQYIDRVYPQELPSCNHYKQSRSSNSFTKVKVEEKSQRRQRSLIHPHRTASPAKTKENCPPKPLLEPVKPEQVEGLKRTVSRKHLLKKRKSKVQFKK